MWSVDIAKQANEDCTTIKKLLARSPRRRAAPPWGAPSELWSMLFSPKRRVSTKQLGLGARTIQTSTPLFFLSLHAYGF